MMQEQFMRDLRILQASDADKEIHSTARIMGVVLFITFTVMLMFFLCRMHYSAMVEGSDNETRPSETATSRHMSPRKEEVILDALVVNTYHKKGKEDVADDSATHLSLESMEAGEAKDDETVGTDDECAICLIDFEEGDEVSKGTVCSHTYHLKCISVWISVHDHCPVCRAQYHFGKEDGPETQ